MFKKPLKIIIIFLLLGSIIYLGWLYNQTKNLKLDQKDKDTALKTLLERSPNREVPSVPGSQSYSNQYYSILYPKAAVEYQRDNTYKPSPTELSYFAFQESSPRLFFVVTVLDRPGISLDDFPAVSIRREQSSLYLSSQVTAGGQSGVIFTRNTPDDSSDLEKSAFFIKDGRLYSFSLTGGDSVEINKLFSSVMASLKFD